MCRIQQARFAFFLFLAAVILMTAGCKRGVCEKNPASLACCVTTSPNPAECGTRGFSHTQHFELGLKCSPACHALDTEEDYKVGRPGAEGHSPCIQCHADAFEAHVAEPRASDPLCESCHEANSLLDTQAAALEPFPRPRRVRSTRFIQDFNHEKHMRFIGACEACHTPDPEAPELLTFPSHVQCASCHSEGGIGRPWLDGRPDQCLGCHGGDQLKDRQLAYSMNAIRFSHAQHAQQGGKKVLCEQCHSSVLKSTSRGDLKMPGMRQCESCHTDSNVTGADQRMQNCALCHTDGVE